MKQKLFVDFDSTICDSIEAYYSAYRLEYGFRQDFKEVDYTTCQRWDLFDIAPLVENPQDIFSSRQFFLNLNFFPNAKEVLYELSKVYDITIVSIGTFSNISYKARFIKDFLPFIHNTILIANQGCKMDKSMIRMQSDNNDLPNIFIDDNGDCLQSQALTSNLRRYCFGVKKPWNSENWIDKGGRWLKDWNEVREELLHKTKVY